MMRQYQALIRHEGNDALFRAIDMSVVSTLENVPLHIHVEGLRGTGKTTIMRAARSVLPPITRVKGCLYNCDSERPHCPDHRGLDRKTLKELGTEACPMPFLEISASVKMGTAVGSLDLARITNRSQPDAALLPGTIPQAHRGILFIDEINRLAETAPEIADVLLGVMGTKPGIIKVEETGLPPVTMPITVSVWAASNPDEDPGPLEDIRKQLSDRFDLGVGTQRPSDAGCVLDILRDCQAAAPGEHSRKAQEFLAALAFLDEVHLPWAIRNVIAGLYVEFQLESLRAVEALQACSRLTAALERSREVRLDHLAAVVPLVLKHRVDLSAMEKIVERLLESKDDNQDVAGAKPGPQGARAKSQDKEAKPAGSLHRMVTDLRNKLFPGSNGEGQGQPGAGNRRSSPGNDHPGMSGMGSSSASVPLTCPPLLACPLAKLRSDEVLRGEEELMSR
ncbi:MAG: magnesium chelatase [Bacillota bacterium]